MCQKLWRAAVEKRFISRSRVQLWRQMAYVPKSFICTAGSLKLIILLASTASACCIWCIWQGGRFELRAPQIGKSHTHIFNRSAAVLYHWHSIFEYEKACERASRSDAVACIVVRFARSRNVIVIPLFVVGNRWQSGSFFFLVSGVF